MEVCACAHDHHYKKVHVTRMVGIMLAIFVKDSVAERISEIQSKHIPTGNMGLGNKGGVLVRMHVDDTSVCFVSAHFAAHRDKVQHRNRDFEQIATRHVFEDFAMKRFVKQISRRMPRSSNAFKTGGSSSRNLMGVKGESV